MASTFALAPRPFDSQNPEPRHLSAPVFAHHHLSPSAESELASPSADLSDTPGASLTHPSQYQHGESDGDSFLDFTGLSDGIPFLLDGHSSLDQPPWLTSEPASTTHCQHELDAAACYPHSSAHTSAYVTPPRSELKDAVSRPTPDRSMFWVSPGQFQKSTEPVRITIEPSDLTPSRTTSDLTSEDGQAPVPITMDPPSPRVTVSVWDQEDGPRARPVERSFDDCSDATQGDIRSAGDLISSAHGPDLIPGTRVSHGWWQDNSTTQRQGIDPERRVAIETLSINEVAAQRTARDRNQEVDKWLAERIDVVLGHHEAIAQDAQVSVMSDFNDDDGIPLGDDTENRCVAGQTYYNEQGSGPMSQIDRDIIAADHKWADAPVLPHIIRGASGSYQPQSSQAAIERFERMCRDNDSIISRSATWGTRRRSHPSVLDLGDEDGMSGGFLKKLTTSRGNGDKGSKSGNLLRELREIVRRPSVSSIRKRSRSRSRSGRDDEDMTRPAGEQLIKRESIPHLSPTSGKPSWPKKFTPSINTTLASMAHNFVSMGSPRPRSGSISSTTPAASSKSSLTRSLSVRNTLKRPRSKSEIPKTSANPADSTETHPNLVGMWKRSGGPPVATLGKSGDTHFDDDDDDEDDELYNEDDHEVNSNIIDDIPADFAGFRQHVLTLNPGLDKTQRYLVDRIAQQQVVRYKFLQNAKVKHLRLGKACPCGALCMALGGSAKVFDQRGDACGIESLNDGEDGVLAEGFVAQESFPPDIPMPPTQRLPSEFECQLCYQRRRFQKPSDWTKHVHEDVQPFTCTWDKCRDHKIFKRKADWVRHENEGHRHLEWWTCDVDDCRHTCYRRDNFLQHLVREHKFLEPRVKTKAAMKREGGSDPTWLKVEQCHVETSARPQDEPCRFCGKVLPSWKKLTVHLAKHMEQISLPVLRLVAARAKEVDADTVVSPVQDPPPRCTVSPCSQTTSVMGFSSLSRQPDQYQTEHHEHMSCAAFAYPAMASGLGQEQAAYYAPQFHGNGQSLRQPTLGVGGMDQGYEHGQQMQGVASRPDGFGGAPLTYPNDNGLEPFPQLDALGLHSVGEAQMGGQIGYDAMMGPCSMGGSPFSGQESLSTYSHSPHQCSMQGPTWEEAGLAGFL